MLTIYKASAGSGKTYNLALEYIRLLLGVKLRAGDSPGRYVLNSDRYAPGGRRFANRHRSILAITFTNPATDEMKRRIIRELKLLADSSPGAAYGSVLCSAFGCTEAELAAAARASLGELLYDYGGFNVSTIDSFFQTIVRTFSREIDHQGDYELTLNEDEAINISVSGMLDELNYSPEAASPGLLAWIRNYTMKQVQEGGSFNFFQREGTILRRLARFMSGAMDEVYRSSYADAIEAYLADPGRIVRFTDELNYRLAHACDDAREDAARAIAMLGSSGVRPELIKEPLLRFVQDIIDRPAELRGARLTAKFVAACLDDTTEDRAFLNSSKFRKADLAMMPEYSAVLAPMRAAVAEFMDATRTAAVDRLMLEAAGNLRFLSHAGAHLRRYLQENNMVMISDTNELLYRIINGAELPFIYERVGMQLTNLLIDEFQDTSRRQWDNLRPLVGMSVHDQHDNLIIGDEKQAIYRFRNSDSSLLGHLVADQFPGAHRIRGFEPADNTNRRSSAMVVRFNNTLFRNMASIMDADSYGNVVQTPFKDSPAYIRVLVTEGTKPDKEAVFEDMARQILRQHADGYRWSDILILVRWRKEAAEIVDFLTSRHPEIRILSNEALLLSKSEAARTVISMVRLVQQSYTEPVVPDDRTAIHYGTRSEIELMETRFNYFLGQGHTEPDALAMALDGNGPDGSLAAEVASIRARNPANLVAMIETVIALKLTPAQRAAEHAYLTALQDLALKHCEGSDASVTAFLDAYDRNIHSWAIKAPADIDAVQIMTIHKSKGLERDCVHIPLAAWGLFRRSQMSFWMPLDKGYRDFPPDTVPPALYLTVPLSSPLCDDPAYGPFCAERFKENIIDSLNLCYVAFTRAVRELNVCTMAGTKPGEEMGYYIRRALASGSESTPHTIDLSEGLVDDAPDEYASCSEVYIFGAPTSPLRKADGKASSEINPDGEIQAGGYPVVFRRDTRELTSIDNDLFAISPDDLGDEPVREIVDPVPPFAATAAMAEAARTGNLLHGILADMRTLADLERSVRRAAVRFGIDSNAAAGYADTIRQAFEAAGPDVTAWFDPGNKVFAERSIYLARTDETFRPDRVIVTPDGRTVVIDYKFTSRPRQDHARQVELYLSLLSRLGHTDLEGYIWYPLLEKVVRVM